jgi:aromatic ring-opening dioxygenase LigB subunit
VEARETLLGEQCMGVVEKAKSCGWPGFCAVQGCLEAQASTTEVVRGEVPTPAFTTQEELMARSTVPGWSGRVWAYAAPTYFGMMVATYDVQA